MTRTGLVTAREIAAQAGISYRSVQRHLQEMQPDLHGQWKRLEPPVAAAVVAELKAAMQECPGQPRRAIRRKKVRA